MTIVEFLEARIAEDEAAYHPATVYVSGGFPAPEIPNCVGAPADYCHEGWRLASPEQALPGWWKTDDVQAQMRAHELTHVTQLQRRMLAECAAKRAIIAQAGAIEKLEMTVDEEWGGGLDWLGEGLLITLAAVYNDHPDYQQEWYDAT